MEQRDDERRELEQEHSELFEELRAVIPGAEVLFAFLLTAPFSSRFDALNERQRGVYFFIFLAAVVTLLLLLAPSVFHRVQFRQGDKEAMLRVANVEALVALGVMSVSMPAAVFLVTDLLHGPRWASLVAGLALGVALAVWWAVPVWRHLTGAGARSRDVHGSDRARGCR